MKAKLWICIGGSVLLAGMFFIAGAAVATKWEHSRMQTYRSAVFVMSLSTLDALSTNNVKEATNTIRTLCRESSASALNDRRGVDIFGGTYRKHFGNTEAMQ